MFLLGTNDPVDLAGYDITVLGVTLDSFVIESGFAGYPRYRAR